MPGSLSAFLGTITAIEGWLDCNLTSMLLLFVVYLFPDTYCSRAKGMFGRLVGHSPFADRHSRRDRTVSVRPGKGYYYH